jgi:ornithine cyclodeaminase
VIAAIAPTDSVERFTGLGVRVIQAAARFVARDEIEAGVLAVTPIGGVIEKRAPGRRSDNEITIFDSSGISLQDLYMADALIRAKASHR